MTGRRCSCPPGGRATSSGAGAVEPTGGGNPDAGVPTSDGGAKLPDAPPGLPDGQVAAGGPDGSVASAGDGAGGCSCRATGSRGASGGWLAGSALVVLAVALPRRRGGGRRGACAELRIARTAEEQRVRSINLGRFGRDRRAARARLRT